MIYAIVGPTCSKKSDFADFLSKKTGFPVINFDAFQIYKELEKGTAKPSKELLESGNYYLYDFKSVLEDYDVKQYQEDARNLLKQFNNDNVIFVGGTGLYLKAALYDYKFYEEEPMPEDYLIDLTNRELYEKLLAIDVNDAIKIGQNNRKRLLRALYIYEVHGKSKSDINCNGKEKKMYDNIAIIGINPPRELLYENINLRVDKMFEDGLAEEVSNLFSYYGNSLRAFSAIGYKEFKSNLSNEEIKELIKKNTRNYAKRQITFFKNQFEDIKWFASEKEAENYYKDLI